MNILILGANSKIGLSIIHELNKTPKVKVIKHARKKIDNSFHTWDFSKPLPANKLSLLINMEIDLILCISGPTKVINNNFTFYNDIILNSFELSKALNNVPIFFFSSSAVYGTNKLFCSEDDEVNPINFYGKSKVFMEKKIIEISLDKKFNSQYFILRLGNFLGADSVSSTILKLKKNEDFILEHSINKKTPIRSYLTPNYLVKIIERLYKNYKNSSAILNIANPGANFEIKDVVYAIHKYYEESFNIIEKRNDMQPSDITLDTTKIKKIYKTNKLDLDIMILESFNHLKIKKRLLDI